MTDRDRADDHRVRRHRPWSNARSARARPIAPDRLDRRRRQDRHRRGDPAGAGDPADARWPARSWSISDGNENVGKAVEQARVASAAGVPIQVVPLAQQAGPEVLVRQVETPAFVREGEKFSATLTLEASQDTQARVHLLADGRLPGQPGREPDPGHATASCCRRSRCRPGFHLFRVQVEASADTYVQNNEGGSYTVVTGKPRVLIDRVRARRDAATWPTRSSSAGLGRRRARTPQTAVIDLPTLRGYESVVLANVPAADLSASQMRRDQLVRPEPGRRAGGGRRRAELRRGPLQPHAARGGAAGQDGPARPDADRQRRRWCW